MSVIIRESVIARTHVRHLVMLCKYAKIERTRSTFLHLHDTLPGTIEDAENGQYVKRCYFYELLQKTKLYRLNPQQLADIRAATQYAFDKWPRYSVEEKTQIREEIAYLLMS